MNEKKKTGLRDTWMKERDIIGEEKVTHGKTFRTKRGTVVKGDDENALRQGNRGRNKNKNR